MSGSQESPARIPLTRERVLLAALGFIDQHGVDALSMRRLGAVLGVEAMSIYNHVPNKAALLDGILEVLLNEIRLPDDPTDWKRSIREMAHSYRKLALSHPNVVPLMATRPFNTIASLRPVEVTFEIFALAGFDPQSAVHAFRTLASFAIGYTLAEAEGMFARDRKDGSITMDDIPIREFPNLIRVAPHFMDSDLDAGFDFALDVMLRGLESKLG
jgi:AcrR family transcriptional regulator